MPSVEEVLDQIELEGIAADVIDWNEIGNIQSQALRNQISEILKLLTNEIKEK